jgi:hypothetical protein
LSINFLFEINDLHWCDSLMSTMPKLLRKGIAAVERHLLARPEDRLG